MLSVTKPTRIRLAGFLATVVGGALIALGCVLSWATVTIGQIGTRNVLTPLSAKGLDTAEGKIALALGVLVLAAIPAMRLTLSRGGRRTWATVVVIASLVGGGLALADAVRPFDEFGQSGCDQIARRISHTTNLPFERLRQRCLEQTANTTQVSLDLGIYLVIAGGAIGALGGALGFVWAGRPTKPGTADPLEQAPSSESE